MRAEGANDLTRLAVAQWKTSSSRHRLLDFLRPLSFAPIGTSDSLVQLAPEPPFPPGKHAGPERPAVDVYCARPHLRYSHPEIFGLPWRFKKIAANPEQRQMAVRPEPVPRIRGARLILSDYHLCPIHVLRFQPFQPLRSREALVNARCFPRGRWP